MALAKQSASLRCAVISDKGINSSRDFAQYMSALMSDITSSRIEPRVAAAACNAGGKLLKVIEMEHKYGRGKRDGAPLVLSLT